MRPWVKGIKPKNPIFSLTLTFLGLGLLINSIQAIGSDSVMDGSKTVLGSTNEVGVIIKVN